MNKKERRLALATALQSAASCTTVVEDLTVQPRLHAANSLRTRSASCALRLVWH